MAIRAQVHRSMNGKVQSLTWTERGSRPRDATRLDNYVQENVSFSNGAVRLVGNLTMPKSRTLHPAVVLIHGCCGILPTRDFGYWSTYLAGKGIAVLAYDRRGGGESTGDANTATYEDIADDVLAGLAFLESRKDIDPRRIGFFGMSNGGYIAPLAAARSHGHVAFIAVRSGSARRVGDNIAYEVGNDLRSEAFSESDVARAVAIRQRVTDFVIGHPSISVPAWDSLRAEVAAVSGEKWFPWSRVLWVPRVSPADPGGLAYLNSLRASWKYDPIPDWRRVRVPVYIMLGGLDRSVPTAESAKLFRATFAAAGVKDVTVRVFPAGNHGLLEAHTGFQRETHTLGYYVAGFQEDLARWIQSRAGSRIH
jgi:dienelactone hydrolase